jgi:CoA:oxalate CoA-transferase
LKTDPRFAERETRKRNRYKLRDELEKALAARSAAEWETALNAKGVPAGRVLSVPDVLEHPQIRHRDLLQTFERVPGVDRAVGVVRGGFKLSGGKVGVDAPPPALGADTDAILKQLGFDETGIADLREAKAI